MMRGKTLLVIGMITPRMKEDMPAAGSAAAGRSWG